MNKRPLQRPRFLILRKGQRGRGGKDEGLRVGRRTRNGALDLDRVGGSTFVVVQREGDDLIRVGVTDRRVVIGEGERLLLLKALLVGYRQFADVVKKSLTVGAHDRKRSKVAHSPPRFKGRGPAPIESHPVLDRLRTEIEYTLQTRRLGRDRRRFHPASDPGGRGHERQ